MERIELLQAESKVWSMVGVELEAGRVGAEEGAMGYSLTWDGCVGVGRWGMNVFHSSSNTS